MWYESTEKKKLNMDEPIIAVDGRNIMLLTPVKEHNSYIIIGYDWLSLMGGSYNSCRCWKTAEDAIEFYSYYEIKNIDINSLILKELKSY